MTEETIFVALACLLWMYYVAFVSRIRRGMRKLTIPQDRQEQPMVTVVVAVHNEESTIVKCLQSLLDQSYPVDKMEIMVVDDASTDRTGELVNAMAASSPRIKPMILTGVGARSRNRKPEAIAEGIKQGTGEIIFTTDADCAVQPDWITSTLPYFSPDTALVAGPVRESGATNLLGRLSSLEFLGLIAAAAGLISNKTPIFCNGANLAYRRSAFIAAGGFGDSFTSCDDELFLQRVHTRRIGRIRFCADPRSIVLTGTIKSFPAFLQQRMRWASKRGHYERKRIFVTLVILYLNFVSLMVLPILSLFNPHFLWLTLFLYVGKFVVDFATLAVAGSMFRQSFSFAEFIIAELFHVPYIVIAAFLGQVVTPLWKGTRTTP